MVLVDLFRVLFQSVVGDSIINRLDVQKRKSQILLRPRSRQWLDASDGQRRESAVWLWSSILLEITKISWLGCDLCQLQWPMKQFKRRKKVPRWQLFRNTRITDTYDTENRSPWRHNRVKKINSQVKISTMIEKREVHPEHKKLYVLVRRMESLRAPLYAPDNVNPFTRAMKNCREVLSKEFHFPIGNFGRGSTNQRNT